MNSSIDSNLTSFHIRCQISIDYETPPQNKSDTALQSTGRSFKNLTSIKKSEAKKECLSTPTSSIQPSLQKLSKSDRSFFPLPSSASKEKKEKYSPYAPKIASSSLRRIHASTSNLRSVYNNNKDKVNRHDGYMADEDEDEDETITFSPLSTCSRGVGSRTSSPSQKSMHSDGTESTNSSRRQSLSDYLPSTPEVSESQPPSPLLLPPPLMSKIEGEEIDFKFEELHTNKLKA